MITYYLLPGPNSAASCIEVALEKPSCWQTTCPAFISHWSSHTVPQVPLAYTSTLPVYALGPSANRTVFSGATRTALLATGYRIHVLTMASYSSKVLTYSNVLITGAHTEAVFITKTTKVSSYHGSFPYDRACLKI